MRRKTTMLPRTLKALTHLKARHVRSRYPNVPLHALPKMKMYEDRSSNGLTHCIIDAINLSGGQAERISSKGRAIDNTYAYTDALGRRKTIGGMKWIPGSGANGSADISATISGRSIKIKVKAGKNKVTPQQIAYGQQVGASGGIYIIARTYEQLVGELERRLSDG